MLVQNFVCHDFGFMEASLLCTHITQSKAEPLLLMMYVLTGAIDVILPSGSITEGT